MYYGQLLSYVDIKKSVLNAVYKNREHIVKAFGHKSESNLVWIIQLINRFDMRFAVPNMISICLSQILNKIKY